MLRRFFATTDTNDDTTSQTRASSSSPDGQRKKGFFSGNRRTSTTSTSSDRSSNSRRTGRSGTGLFGKKRRSIDQDPSIINARQKVSAAEQAEKDADRALIEARKQVQLAREHVNTLGQEAGEDARLAKLKQAEAKVINKTAKSLGRHGP